MPTAEPWTKGEWGGFIEHAVNENVSEDQRRKNLVALRAELRADPDLTDDDLTDLERRLGPDPCEGPERPSDEPPGAVEGACVGSVDSRVPTLRTPGNAAAQVVTSDTDSPGRIT